MTADTLWKACGLTLAGLLVLGTGAVAATPDAIAPAPTLAASIDIWFTPDTGARVEDLFIPADFFCRGSLARAVDIPLKGKPIVTAPANVLGTTDTIVHRLNDAVFSGGSADVDIQVVGLSFVGSAPFDVPECGQSYQVRVCLAPGAEDQVGAMRIYLNGSRNGGLFDAFLPVSGAVAFRNGGVVLGPLVDTVQVTTQGGHWADAVGAGGIDDPGPIQLDQDCDGQADDGIFPGTSGFHPGWSWNPPPTHTCPSPPCKVPTPHTGPHPDTLPPGPAFQEVDPVDPVEPAS